MEEEPLLPDQEQARQVVLWKHNEKPAPAQRGAHEATHLPYAWLCQWCVQARATDNAHPRGAGVEGPPIVELNYAFMRTYCRS